MSVRTVAGQVFFLQVAMVVLLVAAAVVALLLQARRDSAAEARHTTLAAANSFAHAPGIVDALESPDPTAVLQPRAEAARRGTDVEFISVMTLDGVRYTHPDPTRIGTRVGDTEGFTESTRTREPFTRTYDTSRGPSVVSVVPVPRPDGSVVGLVAAGITIEDVNRAVDRMLPVVLGTAAGALVVASGGAALVSRRLRRQTRGLGPAEMTRMYEHHDAVLHAVREGVVIVGGDGRVLLANDEARRLLDLPADVEGRHVTALGLEGHTAELLASSSAVSDEVHLTGDRLLAVSVRPTAPYGGQGGSVATLRDSTELRELSGRAEVTRERLKLLYDAGVRIGTTLDVVRTAEELAEVAVPRFADFVTVELLEAVLSGEEPAGPSGEMRRVAVRGLHADQPLYPAGQVIGVVPGTPMAEVLGSGHGVLEADLTRASGWRAQDPERAERVLEYGIHSLVVVPMRARGVVLGLVNFWRSERPDPFGEEDLSFAEELAARAAVCIDNARRYTREHTMAVTLQRRLLPRELPEQSAVEVAHRYLPAQAGVGGDWFDVIPLPGARVALMVGDVVGQGLHAAATMGRLRTAVHNFSSLDLPPDELLSHLDELVARIDVYEAPEDDGTRLTGATCLYAIYDPVAGVCTMGRAGHLAPAVVHPDGAVVFPDVPASPPLGAGGGLPFETCELRLREGSRLVLYTDGLVEDGPRDLDTGLEMLRTVLSGNPERNAEETCRAVLEDMRPERPGDDIALLVARTRLLDPGKVAGWDVPSDPASVAPLRAACARQLDTWGLGEIAFATELILSELITNAIRYGTQPIRVRMIHDRNLTCEVSDGSSTSPHLRRAKSTDEGGRGLFLVARFADRWGTRYTPRGKVIWSEQPLHDGAGEPDADLGEILLDQWDDTGW
ncbi:SpoIIE family protein phosphatase [Streptomyces sp. SYSU K217416]